MSPAISGFCSLPVIALNVLYVPFQSICVLLARSHILQELIGKLLIGDTTSVLGCYKLLAALRCLCGWVTTTFKDWLELNVLGLGNEVGAELELNVLGLGNDVGAGLEGDQGMRPEAEAEAEAEGGEWE